MVIGIFTDSYYPDINGVSTACQTLYKTLKNAGHKVYVITSSKSKKVFIENEDIIRIPGIEVKKLYGYKISWLFNLKAYKILKAINFDIIHIQTEIGIGLFGRILAKRWNIPLIYTYHTMYADYTYYITGNKKRLDLFTKKLLAIVTRTFIDSTTAITTGSKKTKDALYSYGVTKYINVVPTGIDFSFYERSKVSLEEIKEVKDKYKLHDKFVLLTLGRIAKEKSIDITLRALKKYIKLNPNTNIFLLIVGDGPDREDLEDLSHTLELDDYVKFVGKVPHDKVPLYYCTADLFVSSSTSETQGLTYNEAMSCETMVLSKYDSVLEQVIIDRKTGFFFNTIDDFIKTLDEIISLDENSRKQIIENAKENNEKHFSIVTYAKRMEKVYQNAIRSLW